MQTDQIRKIREMMAGLRLTQEQVGTEFGLHPSRLSALLNEEKRVEDLAKLEQWLQAKYIAALGQRL